MTTGRTTTATVALLSLGAVLLAGCGVAPEGTADAGPSGPDVPSETVLLTEPAACPSGMGTPQPSHDHSGTGLPDLRLECLGPGPAVSLAGIPGPAVLTGWASWCGPCRQEMPAFERLAQQTRSEAGAGSLSVWGVLSEDDAAAGADFVTSTAVSFPSVVDSDGALRKALARPGLPVTVLLASDGTVAHVYSGPAVTYDQLLALVSEHLEVDL